MTIIKHTKTILSGAALAVAFLGSAHAAIDVSGIKFEDTNKVGGKDLKLNGAGMRTKLVIKVYAAGLYLTEKKTSVADILKVEGPRRVTLVMARDIAAEDLGKAFMDGINENLDKTEKSKIVGQIGKFGEMFANVDAIKKGDVLHMDWIPGTGTVCELNGKRIGEPVSDLTFYNAVLRIWLGDKPVDRSLKPALLGDAR
ncbi:chalcone isomerase family protein [Massilia sp. Leaf139]|uniref:chalcone isomerase family protein n=1 Tax=Massilia sp. Leaf139 TaxID=1736272 RepID=UPI0006FE76A1|nr:chalcone isomerase family protein [Massilia sp. Leaf139]KQQ88417.1 lipoprotein transmembrane [Massilia sp. Leaf139]